jgi:hypothetical protein
VDLDGDGIGDVISGSWPGELYLFRGLGKGKFAAREAIKDRDGKVIKLGNASTVSACDWQGTGKLDLLVGNIDGHVYRIPNEGTARKPVFGKPQKLTADGKEIKVPGGHTHPVAADWNREGKLDLLVGVGDGSVLLYRNVGSRTEPKLAAARILVAAPPKGPRGGKAKISVVDWNGDGWLDLLVGDDSAAQPEKLNLTDAQKAQQKKLQERLKAVTQEADQVRAEQKKREKAVAGETGEDRAERLKKLQVGRDQLVKLDSQRATIQEALSQFEPRKYHGYVWLFLRNPPKGERSR